MIELPSAGKRAADADAVIRFEIAVVGAAPPSGSPDALERELRAESPSLDPAFAEKEQRLEEAERVLEAGLSALEVRQQRLSQLEREWSERSVQLEARDAELEQRAVELEAAFELREDRAERRESELAARERRLDRKEAELADYVAQLQAELSR